MRRWRSREAWLAWGDEAYERAGHGRMHCNSMKRKETVWNTWHCKALQDIRPRCQKATNEKALHGRSLVFGRKTTQTQIIHNVFDLFDPILDPIAAFAKRVVPEIENLESRMHVLDELRNLHWSAVVPQSNRVAGETSQFVQQ